MWSAFIIGLIALNAVASLPPSSLNEDIDIVGGHEIDIKDAPHQVFVLILGRKGCGGSIVSKHYILTAAHCVENGGTYKIRAGSSNKTSGGVEVKSKALRHPNYSDATHDYDVALLKLERPLELSDRIKIVKMADKNYVVPAGDLVEVTGWGVTEYGSQDAPDILRSVTVPVVSDEVCIKAYDRITRITPNMICAGEGGKDSCQQDSGGPLVHKGILVGVVSFGQGCGKPGYPGVYAKVAALRDWIDKNMK